MSKILVRKQEMPGMAATVGAGGPGVSFLLGAGGAMDPNSEKFQDMYGEVGSPSHTRAMRMQGLGRMGRYGLAGYGALTSAYNQMASGEPGLGSAVGSGAMAGYYGSSGIEDFAARAGQRFGRELDRYNYADFTEIEDDEMDSSTADPRGSAPKMVPEPTVALREPTNKPINAAMGNIRDNRTVYDDVQRRYGRPTTVYDDILQRYGQ